MSSPTLLRILELWTGDPTTEESPIKLPFDIEIHCREQDKLQARVQELEAALTKIDALGMYCCDDEGMGLECPAHRIANAVLNGVKL